MYRGVLTGLCLFCLSVAGARAGAWTQPEGGVQVISSTIRTIAPVGAFFGDATDQDKNATSLFVEYGVLEEFTLGASFFGEFSSTSTEVTTQAGIHGRYLLWRGSDGDVASIQGGVSVPVERWLGNGIGDDQPDSATEIALRGLYGRSWLSDLGKTHVSSEIGLQIRGEGLSEQFAFDATVGHEPFKGLIGLFSLYTRLPFGGDSDGPSVVLSPSIAYTMWPWLGENDKRSHGPAYPNTIQLQVFWDAARPEEGLGLGLSIWKRF